MATKSKKENEEGLLPSSSFHPAEGRGDAPRSHKKVAKFPEHLPPEKRVRLWQQNDRFPVPWPR